MRLPDGRLQLITMPSQSATGTSPATPTTPATPQQQQTVVRPTITLRPQQPPTLVVSSPASQATPTPAPQTRLIMPTGIATGSVAAVGGSSTITIPARPATSILGVAGASPSKPLIISTTGRMPGASVLSATTGTPGAATQQLVSLASGQQVVTTPLLAGQSVVTSQVAGSTPTIGSLPVVSLQSPATSTPTMVALQSSQGTSLLAGQSLLARPLTTTSATSLLGMSLPSAGGTLTLGGQKVAQIIQNSAAPTTSGVNTTVVMATPAGMRTLPGGTTQLQLKTVAASTVAGGKTPLSPLRQVIAPIQVRQTS